MRGGDLRLLRLMARMQPAWQALAPGTAAALLRCLAKLVAERTALPRVLPWLWPLATPEVCGPTPSHQGSTADSNGKFVGEQSRPPCWMLRDSWNG